MSLVADYGSSDDDSVDAASAEDDIRSEEGTVRSIAYLRLIVAQWIPKTVNTGLGHAHCCKWNCHVIVVYVQSVMSVRNNSPSHINLYFYIIYSDIRMYVWILLQHLQNLILRLQKMSKCEIIPASLKDLQFRSVVLKALRAGSA